ncbi:hypothetical protein [Acetatifactor muris]|uniref:hypothetical protein n=1 Tax=Acetatifactor muris TaxID=879566 RepID=UPI0023F193F5|nr:hypothetical protein [Acetatifactor muris]
MKRILIKKYDYENISKIVENDKAVGRAKNGTKVCWYSLFICLFNKYHKADSSELFIVSGKAEMRRKGHEDILTLQYALTSSSIFDYHKMLTHVSYIGYFSRIKLIIMACRLKKNKEIPFGYFLDYILWREFFSILKADQIWGYGHYDRLTTQIALLSVQFGKKYCMRQHGLLSNNMNLPHKIPVNRIIAFDENEIEKFKNQIILNSNCEYQTEYVSSVDFQYTEKSGKRIGIIDTPIEEMIELIRLVEKYRLDAEYIVMLHPLSKIRKNFLNRERMKLVEGKKKELNFDVIFSGPSTLAYDYIRAGFNNPIIVYELKDFKVLFDLQETHENVKVCYTLSEFEKNCQKIVSSINIT